MNTIAHPSSDTQELAAESQPEVLIKKLPLINRSEVREFLLHWANTNRSHQWSRVSEETLTSAHEALRAWLINHARKFPSKGKTL